MIKYFCDKCGKEVSYGLKTNININPPYSSLFCEQIFIVCEECLKLIEDFIQDKTNG